MTPKVTKSKTMTDYRKIHSIIESAKNHAKTWQAKASIEDLWTATDYSEPGYSQPESKLIVFANWNKVSHWDKSSNQSAVDDDIMPRLGRVLEKRYGAEINWSDEWTSCCDCGKAVRIQPDSYSWIPSYVDLESEIVCCDCLDPESILLELEGKLTKSLMIESIDPADHGYVLLEGEFESGFHPGQNANPRTIGKNLIALGITRFLFKIDSVGQFDTTFSAWVHQDELEAAQLALSKASGLKRENHTDSSTIAS